MKKMLVAILALVVHNNCAPSAGLRSGSDYYNEIITEVGVTTEGFQADGTYVLCLGKNPDYPISESELREFVKRDALRIFAILGRIQISSMKCDQDGCESVIAEETMERYRILRQSSWEKELICFRSGIEETMNKLP